MPLPRRTDFDAPRVADGRPGMGSVPTLPWATGRKPTRTESKRRYRRGHRAHPAHTIGHEKYDPWWTEPRNGLPAFKPYVYRGSGRDAYDGTCLFEEIAS